MPIRCWQAQERQNKSSSLKASLVSSAHLPKLHEFPMTAYSAVDFAQRPTRSTDPLFRPITVEGIKLGNRIAMAPMTRRFAPRGVLSPAAASYYAARARGGVGLIVTEGVALPDPVAEIESTIDRKSVV